jgi:6-phosphogluconolactonase
MTMTYPLLWAARHVVFLVCGADKAEATKRIFSNDMEHLRTEANAETPPAAVVRVSTSNITWILDAPAAQLLPEVSPS